MSELQGRILVDEPELLVLAKPAGVLVHPGQEDGSPVVTGPETTLWPVHRLDRETSGVLVLARTAPAAAHLGRSFAEGRVEKRYLALVRGVVHEKGVIRRPLTDGGRALEAISRYRRLELFDQGLRCSLVLIRPATGRQHQVRRHLAGIGHPILGDRRYGSPEANQRAERLTGLSRLFLHAAALTLPHPRDGQKRTWSAGLPPELVEVLLALGAGDRLLQRWDREPSTPGMWVAADPAAETP